MPKAVGQSVKRNTPFPEIKSLLQLIAKPRHVRHHEGGTELVGLSIGQQADFSLGDAKFFGFDDNTKMKTPKQQTNQNLILYRVNKVRYLKHIFKKSNLIHFVI